MIDRVIDFSVRHRLLVILLVAVAALGGWWSLQRVPLDAIPDLSDTQVIIYSRWDQSPDLVEAHVTYPIVTALTGAPRVKAVRGFSDFGFSYVYVVFEDGTDSNWARSRTMEQLSAVLPVLPAAVRTELGPDATALGWVFQYALVDQSGKHDLADLRSYQDWHLRYQLKSVAGVADVASLGGFGKQYQVKLDPNRLRAFSIPIGRVIEAVRAGNADVGGRLIDFGGFEFMVRGRGYAKTPEDLENIVLVASPNGTPIRIRDVGQVVVGPDQRRGASDLDGTGEVVSGIVIARQGENTLGVINRVKQRLSEITSGLPPNVTLVPIYDRSELIRNAITSLKATVLEIIVTVALVILVFLWHVPSAMIPVVTIALAVLISFLPFRLLGMSANIMSLGGIAIAIGALVDASIVMVEQVHKKLEHWQAKSASDYQSVIVAAIKEVGGPSFFGLLVIAVSFLPVLTLEAQEGRLFKPLAYAKSLSMLMAAALTVTLVPALMVLVIRLKKFDFRPWWICRVTNVALVATIHAEAFHPISRGLIRAYEPIVRWTLRRRWAVVATVVALMVATLPIYWKLGSEFMPPLDEGALLYMPSTMPGISIGEAQRLLQVSDRILKRFPEVDRVLGKAGRAETSTDPAPLSMLETVIILKPKSEWRQVATWYSRWAPQPLQALLRHVTPDRISKDELVSQLDQALMFPGVANAWTMPIRGRIDMLTTGLRTPVGLKISGAEPDALQKTAIEVEALLRGVPGTRNVFAERIGGGYFLDVEWSRDELARYGLTVDEAQQVVSSAIGGENVTTIVHGGERYPVNVRYMYDFRSDVDAINRVLVPASGGSRQIPLGKLAHVRMKPGPSMIRDENGLLVAYVYVDVATRDVNSYIGEANRVLRSRVRLPAGYSMSWSGQYEAQTRVKERLKAVVPLTLFLIIVLLYLNTRSIPKTLIIVLAVPFSAVGALWFLYMLGYNLSVAVWVGLIALLGVDAETGIFMLLYLDLSYEQARQAGRLHSLQELREAIVNGAARRIRPKFMTAATMLLGLIPIMWATGTGSDVMKRIAAPMIGGILTSFLLELVVYPAVYEIWKWDLKLKREVARAS